MHGTCVKKTQIINFWFKQTIQVTVGIKGKSKDVPIPAIQAYRNSSDTHVLILIKRLAPELFFKF